MAIKKISELPEQTGTPAADDLYVTVDTSEIDLSQRTKKIRSDKIVIHQSSQFVPGVVDEQALKTSSVTENKIGPQAVSLGKMDNLGASLPDADRFIFFDKSAGKLQYLNWPALKITDVAVVDKAQLGLVVYGASDYLETGDGKFYFAIPSGLDGYVITKVEANIFTASTSGLPTIQIARGRRSSPTAAPTYYDVLSTEITIDVNEFSSNYATTQPVINPTYAQVLTDDILRVDCDGAGTGSSGLIINLELSK